MIWAIEERVLELKYTWKISRNASDVKTNYIISVSDGKHVGRGEVAPNIRYNESGSLILQQFEILQKISKAEINSLEDLSGFLSDFELANSLRFGVESAFVDYLCKKTLKNIYQILNIPQPGSIQTIFSLPIMEVGLVRDFIKSNNLSRFSRIKIKVNRDNALELLKEVSKEILCQLIIDGNEAWGDPDDFLKFTDAIRSYPVLFIEQPLPAEKIEEYKYLKLNSKYELIADESVTKNLDINLIAEQFHGVNMKLMKAGGFLNGIKILNETRGAGLKTMIGCMVETTLGISAAMHLCHHVDYIDLDGFLIIKNEPFKKAREEKGILYFSADS